MDRPLTDRRPVIPREEFPRRWLASQALMHRLGLDALLAYGDDRAVAGPAHVRWLADVPVHFEPMCVLLLPEGEPVLLTGPESDQYALRVGQVRDVRGLREFTHPDEDYPYANIESLAEILGDLSGQRGLRRVGVAGGGLMNSATTGALRAAVPGADWIDVDSALGELRGVKTEAELAVIRYAYGIAEVGIRAALDAIEVGVTERAVAAEIEAAMRRAGAEGTGIDTIVASGPNSRPILARSTFRTIGPDELVLLTVAPRYEGYHAAIGRPVLLGKPPAEIRRAAETAWRAQEAAAAAMHPGVKGRDAEAIGRRVVEEAGLGQYFLYSGLHSVGVIEFEPPIFGPSSDAELAEHMVISIDIPLFNTPWGGLRMEDGFVITSQGAERLNATPWLIER